MKIRIVGKVAVKNTTHLLHSIKLNNIIFACRVSHNSLVSLEEVFGDIKKKKKNKHGVKTPPFSSI